ncbi:GntR family transcriptional regulator [Rhodobacteraceae bacterium B1Z28]|uniref:GntR family transcriptional regulator n=1 Tax=Ruegeria haliotis TaxID=2747601 RepID=A0ABX2PRE9_9RHOB|nr:GntR family transcriptional regulator [Ruegeria haliotis]NVO56315.1 GntR family transcriptional regulator [Ruegeria haliotis]
MSRPEGSVERAYEALRKMAISFEFKPGERLNETVLTKRLDVSRTPLREALNRLVSEGFLTFELGKGFFCRPLSPEKVFELYQLRCALETEALIRAIESAADQDIDAVISYLDEVEKSYSACTDLDELLRMDEEFHIKLASLSRNSELIRLLCNVNERIRYVRIINLRLLQVRRADGSTDQASMSAHRAILEAVKARNVDKAVAALRSHIERRSEQTVELVRVAYSQLYVPGV